MENQGKSLSTTANSYAMIQQNLSTEVSKAHINLDPNFLKVKNGF